LIYASSSSGPGEIKSTLEDTMTDLETARAALHKAQDEATTVLRRSHTAVELALVRANLKKATKEYAELVRGK
jgi:hypothetical protein